MHLHKSPTKRRRANILITQKWTSNLQVAYTSLIRYYQANIDFKSFTEVKLIPLSQFRKHKSAILNHTVFLFTNSVAVNSFFKLAKACNIVLNPKTTKYFLGNEKVIPHLKNHIIEIKKRKTFYGKYQLEDLFVPAMMKKYAKERFFLPSSDIGRQKINDFFEKVGYDYACLPIYRNDFADLSDLKPSDYEIIAFFSPFAVQSFVHNFPNYQFEKTKIAAFSEKTIKEIKKHGWEVTIATPTIDKPSMVKGLEYYLDEMEAKERIPGGRKEQKGELTEPGSTACLS